MRIDNQRNFDFWQVITKNVDLDVEWAYASENEIKPSRVHDIMMKHAKHMGEAKCCAVIALAITTKESFYAAHTALSIAGRHVRQGTPCHVMNKAIGLMGYKKVPVEGFLDLPKIISKRLGYDVKEVNNSHVIKFPDLFKNWDNVLVRSKGHYYAAIEGRIEDWTWNKKTRMRGAHYLVKE